MAITPEQFVGHLLDLGVVSTSSAETCLAVLDDPAREDLRQTIGQFVKAGLITRYQTAKILKGQGEDLVLGNYLLLNPIGRGGMGVVYRAKHRWMDRIVALKILKQRSNDEKALRRFQREIQAAAKLSHPNIVTAFDADESHGRLYLAMEYVPGEDLVTLIKQHGPFPMAKAISCVIQAAKGLHYAHQQRLVHRDIKPSNLLLDYEGNLKILDMGLARIDSSTTKTDTLTVEDPSGLTNPNQLLGTVDFMSPEQADESNSANEQSDIYSLGCTLFYLLTGKAPFHRSTLINTLMAHRLEPIPKIRDYDSDIPAELQSVFESMVAKIPAERCKTAADVVKALTPFDDDTDFEVDESLSLIIDEGEDTKVFEFDPMDLSSSASSVPANPSPNASNDSHDTTITDTVGLPPCVGIDLGTHSTVIAAISPDGQPRVIRNAEGELSTPTSTYITPEKRVLVGRQAVEALKNDPEHGTRYPKRNLGTADASAEIYGQRLPAEVLLAAVLKKVKEDAESHLGPIKEVVISVPTFFDETRRLATQNAGFLAGLTVMDIVNETTATALAYALKRNSDSSETPGSLQDNTNFMIYDLGGGTFDVTVMNYQGGTFRTLSTDGDFKLGSHNWDLQLLYFINRKIQAATHVDVGKDRRLQLHLQMECEAAKEKLAEHPTATVRCRVQGRDITIKVTREVFEKVTSDLLDRTEICVHRVMKNANLGWSAIDHILLVGKATELPSVTKMLNRVSGIDPHSTESIGEVVSHGAAIHAYHHHFSRAGKSPKLKVQNVSTHSLGVSAMNPRNKKQQMSVLLPKNTTLPATATRIYRLRSKSQRRIVIPILEGESLDPNDCHPLGRCILASLPEDLRDGCPIEVKFTYRQNGRLSLKVMIDGKKWDQKLQRYTGLTNRQLLSWKTRLDADDLYNLVEAGFSDTDDLPSR